MMAWSSCLAAKCYLFALELLLLLLGVAAGSAQYQREHYERKGAAATADEWLTLVHDYSIFIHSF